MTQNDFWGELDPTKTWYGDHVIAEEGSIDPKRLEEMLFTQAIETSNALGQKFFDLSLKLVDHQRAEWENCIATPHVHGRWVARTEQAATPL